MNIPTIDPFAIQPGSTAPAFDADIFGAGEGLLHHGDIKIGLVNITPEMATRWLDRYNTHNRNAIKSAIAGYSRDMVQGDWLLAADHFDRQLACPEAVDQRVRRVRSAEDAGHLADQLEL